MKTMKAAQFDPVSTESNQHSLRQEYPKILHALTRPPRKAIGKVTVREIPIPQHGDDELLVKIEAASLCHSDLVSQHYLLSVSGAFGLAWLHRLEIRDHDFFLWNQHS